MDVQAADELAVDRLAERRLHLPVDRPLDDPLARAAAERVRAGGGHDDAERLGPSRELVAERAQLPEHLVRALADLGGRLGEAREELGLQPLRGLWHDALDGRLKLERSRIEQQQLLLDTEREGAPEGVAQRRTPCTGRPAASQA